MRGKSLIFQLYAVDGHISKLLKHSRDDRIEHRLSKLVSNYKFRRHFYVIQTRSTVIAKYSVSIGLFKFLREGVKIWLRPKNSAQCTWQHTRAKQLHVNTKPYLEESSVWYQRHGNERFKSSWYKYKIDYYEKPEH